MNGRARGVTVHGLDDALAAATAAAALSVPLLLVSAPSAGIYAGAGWFVALVAAVRAAHPTLTVHAILDCGPGFGAVLAALRAGQKDLVFTGPQQQTATLAALAAAHGASLAGGRPPSLDLRHCRDKVGACRAWLAGGRTGACTGLEGGSEVGQ